MNIREESRSNGVSRLQFAVRDTGVGMAEEYMERIFQPFEQENPGNGRDNIGSGLGLSIVYNLVQLMGGTIAVESKKGVGTTFTVEIPMELASSEKVEKTKKPASAKA